MHNVENFDGTTASKILKITDLEQTTEVDILQRNSSEIFQHRERGLAFQRSLDLTLFGKCHPKIWHGSGKHQPFFQIWIIIQTNCFESRILKGTDLRHCIYLWKGETWVTFIRSGRLMNTWMVLVYKSDILTPDCQWYKLRSQKRIFYTI